MWTFPMFQLPHRAVAQTARQNMKKNLHILLDDEDIIELMRILLDEDAESALAFLKKHTKGKTRELLEGG
jgi:hypothetical protein